VVSLKSRNPIAHRSIDIPNMAASQLRAFGALTRGLRVSSRTFTTTARQLEAAVPAASKTETAPAPVDESVPKEVTQAPNRVGIWSKNQKPRSQAMTGPRFEQTDYNLQVRERASD
jgi:NADH dehydrogenase (ubiquinone) Fe-S protein 6